MHAINLIFISHFLQLILINCVITGPDWDAFSGWEISHSSRPHRTKRAKIAPFGVQQLVTGAVLLKGHLCTFFTPNRYIKVG